MGMAVLGDTLPGETVQQVQWGYSTTSEVGARKHDQVLLVCNQDMNRLIEWALLPSQAVELPRTAQLQLLTLLSTFLVCLPLHFFAPSSHLSPFLPPSLSPPFPSSLPSFPLLPHFLPLILQVGEKVTIGTNSVMRQRFLQCHTSTMFIMWGLCYDARLVKLCTISTMQQNIFSNL